MAFGGTGKQRMHHRPNASYNYCTISTEGIGTSFMYSSYCQTPTSATRPGAPVDHASKAPTGVFFAERGTGLGWRPPARARWPEAAGRLTFPNGQRARTRTPPRTQARPAEHPARACADHPARGAARRGSTPKTYCAAAVSAPRSAVGCWRRSGRSPRCVALTRARPRRARPWGCGSGTCSWCLQTL